MKQAITRSAALGAAALLLAACSSISLDALSFGGAKEQDTTRPPAGATAYQCEGGARLFVRYLDNGAAAWVILPGREFRLDKAVSASGASYTNGSDALDTKGNEATLREGSAVTRAGCKAAPG
jgi:membrane-bound inhibitor of C-type lysozyme